MLHRPSDRAVRAGQVSCSGDNGSTEVGLLRPAPVSCPGLREIGCSLSQGGELKMERYDRRRDVGDKICDRKKHCYDKSLRLCLTDVCSMFSIVVL